MCCVVEVCRIFERCSSASKGEPMPTQRGLLRVNTTRVSLRRVSFFSLRPINCDLFFSVLFSAPPPSAPFAIRVINKRNNYLAFGRRIKNAWVVRHKWPTYVSKFMATKVYRVLAVPRALARDNNWYVQSSVGSCSRIFTPFLRSRKHWGKLGVHRLNI